MSKEPPTPEELYGACKRLCADEGFQTLWEYIIGSECDRTMDALENEETVGEKLVVTRNLWNILKRLQTEPWKIIKSYEELHQPTPSP